VAGPENSSFRTPWIFGCWALIRVARKRMAEKRNIFFMKKELNDGLE
jgi:hypothetical protein